MSTFISKFFTHLSFALPLNFIFFSFLAQAQSPRSILPYCPEGLEARVYQTQEGLAQLKKLRPLCRKPWTVLVYMQADNDLAPYAGKNLVQMESVGSQAALDIVAQLDDQSSGIKRFELIRDPRRTYGEQDLKISSPFESIKEDGAKLGATPRTSILEDPGHKLKEFLEWGIRSHPSDQTWLIFWGHGRGYSGRLRQSNLKNADMRRLLGGIAFDESDSSFLNLQTIRKVLTTVNSQLLNGTGFSVVSSDACLMQMVEVATELAPVARYVQGSSQVQSFLGLPYRLILAEMAKRFMSVKRLTTSHSNLATLGTPEDYLLAAMIPYLVHHHYRGLQRSRPAMGAGVMGSTLFGGVGSSLFGNGFNGTETDLYTYTASAFSSHTLGREYLPTLKQFSLEFSKFLLEIKGSPEGTAFVSQFGQELVITPATMAAGVDIAVFMGRLEQMLRDSPLRDRASTQRVLKSIALSIRALQSAVISSYYGALYESPDQAYPLFHSRAVAIWIPRDQLEYRARIHEFRSSLFYQWTAWDQWMKILYGP